MDGSDMPRLLSTALEQASRADESAESLAILLTLGGHIPAAVGRRGLSGVERAAVAARFERPDRGAGDRTVFTGELGLTRTGKVVIRVPHRDTPVELSLHGVATRVEWTNEDVVVFEQLAAAERRVADSEAVACRAWLGAREPHDLADLLELLRNTLLHMAPVVLYRDDRVYTNFREQNNLTGKSLLAGHPNCALHGLESISVQEWSDDQVSLVACLALLSKSGGNHRIEECNGTQINLREVAAVFARKAQLYRGAGADINTPELRSGATPAQLEVFAEQLRVARHRLRKTHLLYRRISGPILNKTELITTPGVASAWRESAILGHLRETTPIQSSSWHEAGEELLADSDWLGAPCGEFGTGLEALVYETVSASAEHFTAHFAMSRGFRSIRMLLDRMRQEEWAAISSWELPEFFCCVVPGESVPALFNNSWESVADAMWAMSARMQFNSWHFLSGNLPKVPVVEARDYFTPPTMPDISNFSDQHHRGHVFNRVRFTIRSPQAVIVDDRRFDGFVDLRLVRCEGEPFEVTDLVDAHRVSRFLAAATENVAARAARGDEIEVRAFDHVWHRDWAGRHLR